MELKLESLKIQQDRIKDVLPDYEIKLGSEYSLEEQLVECERLAKLIDEIEWPKFDFRQSTLRILVHNLSCHIKSNISNEKLLIHFTDTGQMGYRRDDDEVRVQVNKDVQFSSGFNYP